MCLICQCFHICCHFGQKVLVLMSKRLSEVPQVPNPHPSTRIGSGTETGIDASIGLQAVDDSNNGADAIADPNSNEDGGIVEAGTNTGEGSNPNITSESTGAVPDEGENNKSPTNNPTSLTKEDNNDLGNEDRDDTTPPATPEFVGQQKLQEEKEDTNNKPPSSITVTDQPECFDESVYTNVKDIDETSNQVVKIGEYLFSAKEWKTGQVGFPSGASSGELLLKKNALCQYRSYICELQRKEVSTCGLDVFEKQVLQDLRTNWRLSLYAQNLTKTDVNDIVCDLYYLGQHYHCDDNGTMIPKRSLTQFIMKQTSD